MNHVFLIGRSLVLLFAGFTRTDFPDGSHVIALHDPQPGQEEMASRMGIRVRYMNRTHDVVHSLMADFLGLEYSPTLHMLATQQSDDDLMAKEEAMVLAVQEFAAAMKIDLLKVAERRQR